MGTSPRAEQFAEHQFDEETWRDDSTTGFQVDVLDADVASLGWGKRTRTVEPS